MIGDDIRLSRRLYDLLEAHPAFEALTQQLSITTFRYVPDDLRAETDRPEIAAYLDRLNRHLLDRVQTSGEAFVSNAVVAGRYALRACIVNFNTTPGDIEALPGIIERLGRDADEALRSPLRSVRSLPHEPLRLHTQPAPVRPTLQAPRRADDARVPEADEAQ